MCENAHAMVPHVRAERCRQACLPARKGARRRPAPSRTSAPKHAADSLAAVPALAGGPASPTNFFTPARLVPEVSQGVWMKMGSGARLPLQQRG